MQHNIGYDEEQTRKENGITYVRVRSRPIISMEACGTRMVVTFGRPGKWGPWDVLEADETDPLYVGYKATSEE